MSCKHSWMSSILRIRAVGLSFDLRISSPLLYSFTSEVRSSGPLLPFSSISCVLLSHSLYLCILLQYITPSQLLSSSQSSPSHTFIPCTSNQQCLISSHHISKPSQPSFSHFFLYIYIHPFQAILGLFICASAQEGDPQASTSTFSLLSFLATFLLFSLKPTSLPLTTKLASPSFYKLYFSLF